MIALATYIQIILSDKTSNAKELKMIVWIATQVIGLVPLLKALLIMANTAFAVTNKRVIGKTGVLKINTLDLHIDKVDSVKMNATFFGRICKFYYIEISGSGTAKPIRFRYIANGPKLKNTITEAIERHAEEARKAQAAEIAMAMSRTNKPY